MSEPTAIDHERAYHQDSERWKAARTLAELAELTAQWLEGKLSCVRFNVEGGGPDPETEPHIATLAAVNRAGYVTDFSQPGSDDTYSGGRFWRQRAAVCGFLGSAAFERLMAALLGTADPGLVVIIHTADLQGTAAGDAMVISMRGDGDGAQELENTWVGQWLDRDDLINEYLRDEPALTWHPAAAEAICDAWQVTIVDSVWGRNDVVWPLLDRFSGWPDGSKGRTE